MSIFTGKLQLPSENEFIAKFGGIFEHSPWIASRAYGELGKNFTEGDLLETERVWRSFSEVLQKAEADNKLDLINAHPDLAGKLARAGELTSESRTEQNSLGLDRLSKQEYELFSDLNSRYKKKFGFPFIICAKENSKESVLKAFQSRLGNTAAQEKESALREIQKIARLRFLDIVAEFTS